MRSLASPCLSFASMLRNRFKLLLITLALLGLGTRAEAASREVTVHFRGNVDTGIPLDFGPLAPAMRVAIGERQAMPYRFTNLSDRTLEIQAVHQVSPASAERAFDRIQCFSLTRQVLKPHESKTLPVTFKVEASLPASVPEISLGYMVYKVRAVR